MKITFKVELECEVSSKVSDVLDKDTIEQIAEIKMKEALEGVRISMTKGDKGSETKIAKLVVKTEKGKEEKADK